MGSVIIPAVITYGEMNSMQSKLSSLQAAHDKMMLDPNHIVSEAKELEQEILRLSDYLAKISEALKSGSSKLEGINLLAEPVSRSIEEIAVHQQTVTSPKAPDSGLVPMLFAGAVVAFIFNMML